MEERPTKLQELSDPDPERCQRPATIDVLPDYPLLEMFSFYVNEQKWYTLVHVCRRWRDLALSSPHRLNLHVICTGGSPVRRMLDVWPAALPMRIENNWLQLSPMEEANNLIAALEHRDRVCRIHLQILPHFPSQIFVAALDESFPALTHLGIAWSSNDTRSLALPDSFLGGSALRLKSLNLETISFPAVPALLLSAGGLVHLSIWNIPGSGRFPPESLGASLASLAALEYFRVGFQYPRSPPDQASRRPPPPTRTTLPALTSFLFRGESEYLDDLVAWIEAPPLRFVEITFFNQPLFSISQLFWFIDRAEHLNALKDGTVAFLRRSAEIELSGKLRTGDRTKFSLVISCTATQRILLSSLVQVFNSFWPLVSTLESFTIKKDRPSDNERLVEDVRWLELLRPLATLKTLYSSESPAFQIVRELQEQLTGEGATNMLPALQTLFMQGLPPWSPIQETIRQFCEARQLSGRPVVVQQWERYGVGGR